MNLSSSGNCFQYYMSTGYSAEFYPSKNIWIFVIQLSVTVSVKVSEKYIKQFK